MNGFPHSCITFIHFYNSQITMFLSCMFVFRSEKRKRKYFFSCFRDEIVGRASNYYAVGYKSMIGGYKNGTSCLTMLSDM
jgi:hypothetical protein